MLTLAVVKRVEYYTKGYYANHGVESLGLDLSFWHGSLAKELELSGNIDHKTLLSLIEGRKKLKRLGYDLTFSAPKSVSIAFLVLGEIELLKAHINAVKRTLDFVENELVLTMRNRVKEKTTKTLTACFTHFTSRDLDPQLHTHSLLLNITQRSDGKLAKVEPLMIFRHQKELGILYRIHLIEELRRLGYEIEITDKEDLLFELKGFDKDLIDAFSTARKSLLQALANLDNIDIDIERIRWEKLEELVRKFTRPKKELMTYVDIQSVWQEKLPRPVRIAKKPKDLKNPSKEKIEQWLRDRLEHMLNNTDKPFTFQRLLITLKKEFMKIALNFNLELPENFDNLVRDIFKDALLKNRIAFGNKKGYFIVNQPEPKPEKTDKPATENILAPASMK